MPKLWQTLVMLKVSAPTDNFIESPAGIPVPAHTTDALCMHRRWEGGGDHLSKLRQMEAELKVLAAAARPPHSAIHIVMTNPTTPHSEVGMCRRRREVATTCPSCDRWRLS